MYNLPATAPRMLMQKGRMPISIRFRLVPTKNGQPYKPLHPLRVNLTVDGVEDSGFIPIWDGDKLLVDPNSWRVSEQRSSRRNDPVNEKITAVKAFIDAIHKAQRQQGRTPTLRSIRHEIATGQMPEWVAGQGWQYNTPAVVTTATPAPAALSADTALTDAYRAYINELEQRTGTADALSPITLGRWKRGLLLLEEFVTASGELPTAGAVTMGWTKRFHRWLQTQDGGKGNHLQPVSEGQASRFVLKVGNVLTWMIEEGWITANPITSIKWPRSKDKEVQFLEPDQVSSLLSLSWTGTEGAALWWFLLMCCTGMDYPDAIAYARNRAAFEVEGPEGWKIVGRRKKPPHNEYHLARLAEVEALFAKYPVGPEDYSAQCVNRHTTLIEEFLGITWRITAKTARKTFGCLMLAAGHRIADVSLMLGHSTITTTERHYVKVRAASIDRSMARVKVSISELANNGGKGEGND